MEFLKKSASRIPIHQLRTSVDFSTTSDGVWQTADSLALPAGVYLMLVNGLFSIADGECNLRFFASTPLVAVGSSPVFSNGQTAGPPFNTLISGDSIFSVGSEFSGHGVIENPVSQPVQLQVKTETGGTLDAYSGALLVRFG